MTPSVSRKTEVLGAGVSMMSKGFVTIMAENNATLGEMSILARQ